jgi:tRNA-N(6)-(isopentenyl)adenosine-37 thiotransferase enzyme MiaB
MKIPNLKEAGKRTNNPVNFIIDDYEISAENRDLGINRKYFIRTYGCQMNVHDSENIKAILEMMSYTETDAMEDADIVILNTCAIRENAHKKMFGFLGRVKHLKQEKPHVLAVVCGCMPQEEEIAEVFIKKYKWVDIVFGTHNIHRLPNLIETTMKNKEQEMEIFSIEGDVIENIPVKRDSKYKAWVNIMFGCDKFCTYCIVPYTRGKQRSRKPEHIIEEVKKLVEIGYLEVTLLGQNVNAYGKDLNMDYTMGNLLEDVAKTNIPRVRFMTSHPWDFDKKMISIIKKYDNIMPSIHLPLQSGSDRILKLMGRRYTKDKYLNLVSHLKKDIPGLSLTTDIIVGFPGETEEDFKETMDVVNECKYDSAFTFLFSPRVGTPAAKMKDIFSTDEKNKKLYELNDVVNRHANENNQKYKGKTVKVLIEGKNEKGNLIGFTETMKLVNVNGKDDNIGKIIDIEITGVKTWSMEGKIV